MSYCRITGRSRGLPKPNYFPLLAPISPADAKRCCRITGKSYGLPSHHYIPVLLTSRSTASKCKITNVSGEIGPHHYSPEINYGNRKHEKLPDFRYIFPVLDGSTETHKPLLDMLTTKNVSDDRRFVYTVQERRCSLVFSAQMEAAVRDGDVRDVMLAKDSDTILIKMKQGRSVSMDFKDMTEDVEMFEGEGPSAEVLKQRELEEIEEIKIRRKRTAGLSSMKKIFENKEKLADVQECEEEKHRQDRVSKKAKLDIHKKKNKEIKTFLCDNFDVQRATSMPVIDTCFGDWKDKKLPMTDSLDWIEIEKDFQNSEPTLPTLTVLPKPLALIPMQCESEVYEIERQISEITTSMDIVPCVNPLLPIKSTPSEDIIMSVKLLDKEKLEDTSNVAEKLLNDGNETALPSILEIPQVTKNLQKGVKSKLSKVAGLTIDIDKAKKFIPGQHVNTPNGLIFVPGQSVQTPSGPVFVPGLSVQTPSGPGLIPGHIVTNEHTNDPIFVAGQTLQTSQGEMFVPGQTMKCGESDYKFIEGQTVFTTDGPKFVPGKFLHHETEDDVFIPGQTIVTPDGVQFVPGQTITDKDGIIFTPGQNTLIDKEWHFVPGQTVQNKGERIFLPGATLPTSSGLKFVPGQLTHYNNETKFVPGVSKMSTNNSLEFIPGVTVDTIDGPKFVEGQLIETNHGHTFFPGTTITKNNGDFDFLVAKSIEDITLSEATTIGLPIDSRSCSLAEDSLYVFGHMVQSSIGIEFYPGSKVPSVEGKIVPGRLVKNEANESRFVPGMMLDGAFVPGQIVFTENGEQFVPGQVVDTFEGPKFVPGQVVNTRTGPKFVPGQTIHTIDGPRFVPGQIIETKAGPTFIPGQVISTEEEGSRFVPGQVVDTEEGPRFVPGRVIETENHGVTFVPGQIVQTPEGLKFVAPDLVEGESGLEFSVQSFVVTPEELKLLKVKTNPNDTTSTRGELSIDTKMLRQLSEAGMAVGRQVPAELPVVDVILNETMNAQILKTFVSTFDLKDEVAEQLMVVIKSILEMSSHLKNEIQEESISAKKKSGIKEKSRENVHITENSEFNRYNQNYESVKNSIAAAVLAAMVTSEQHCEINNNNGKEKYHAILKSINTIIGKEINDEHVSAMYSILKTDDEKLSLCDDIYENVTIPKLELVKVVLDTSLMPDIVNTDIIIDKFSEALSKENEILGPALKNISKADKKLFHKILNNVIHAVSFITNENNITETLQKAIVSAVKDSSDTKLQKIMKDGNSEEIKDLLKQAIGLAKVLGLHQVVSSLKALEIGSLTTSLLFGDSAGLNILKRLTVMRQLAGQDPGLITALKKLEINHEMARTDPKLRDLVRESAALMIVPEEPPLLSSQDVPFSLLQAENSLAMEDFLLQRKSRYRTLLIMKKGLQAVVPRESSRAVLTGQVAYTVLDENGIRHFEPMHVFSALQLKSPVAHRFSMYSCPIQENKEDDLETMNLYPHISQTHCTSRIGGWFNNNKGVLLDREVCPSRIHKWDYTPSYKRYSSPMSRSSGSLSPSKVDDVVVASTDYTAVNDDEVSLRAGDIVEVLDTKSALGAKYKGRVYSYDNHYFQQRGTSLNYIFSAPTYKMYYV